MSHFVLLNVRLSGGGGENCFLSITRHSVACVQSDFLLVLRICHVISLWHSLNIPYNDFYEGFISCSVEFSMENILQPLFKVPGFIQYFEGIQRKLV